MPNSNQTNRAALRCVLALVVASGLASLRCGADEPTNPGPGGGPPADVTIEIVANNGSQSFSPNPRTVAVGQTVAWHNAHNQTHTATANGGAFNTGSVGPGGTSTPIAMNVAGTFGYHCTPHPSMVGTLQVNTP